MITTIPKLRVRNLRRAVIKEEYIAITGDMIRAVVLNQFVYWTKMAHDFDEFVSAENQRKLQSGEEAITHIDGWIYKTAKEMKEEIMATCGEEQVRRAILWLREKGILMTRSNPKYKFDKTIQYRVDLVLLCKLLRQEGYALEGFVLDDRDIDVSALPLEEESEILSVESQDKITTEILKGSQREQRVFLPKIPYPKTEEEMYNTLYEMGLDPQDEKDGNFFQQMQKSNWTIKGKKVWDWVGTFQARYEKITSFNNRPLQR